MKRIKFILGSLFGVLVFAPALAFAQSNFNTSGGFSGFLNSLQQDMNYVVPILIGLAVIAFLYGVLRFIFSSNNDDGRKEAKSMMLYGIIGIVVMVSVWGLVNFIQSTFGLNNNTNHPNYPTVF